MIYYSANYCLSKDLSAPKENGFAAIHFATKHSPADFLKDIANHGTAPFDAEVVNRVINPPKVGYDPEFDDGFKDHVGWRPLYFAIRQNDIAVIEFLLNKGVG